MMTSSRSVHPVNAQFDCAGKRVPSAETPGGLRWQMQMQLHVHPRGILAGTPRGDAGAPPPPPPEAADRSLSSSRRESPASSRLGGRMSSCGPGTRSSAGSESRRGYWWGGSGARDDGRARASPVSVVSSDVAEEVVLPMDRDRDQLDRPNLNQRPAAAAAAAAADVEERHTITSSVAQGEVISARGGGGIRQEEEEEEEEEEREMGVADRTVVVSPGLNLLAGMNVVKSPVTNVLLAGGTHSRIKSAVFVKSSAGVKDCPQTEKVPEFAVIGRSNVGKSSLINMLTNRKDLAEVSKKPGKTRLINHFLINDSWHLVDLPGYGFAKVPSGIRLNWSDFTKEYFLQRKQLVAVLLLVDASIPPQQIDLDCLDWMGRNKIPLVIVFTKCDRKKKKKNGGVKPAENVKHFEQRVSEYYSDPPAWFMTSAVSGIGKAELLTHVAQLRNYWLSDS
ncbi:hypothetical protein CBR_g371 [Chara braunii]|uniref:EngB-type G domain-containing protein n=1 Tax=Chara braunii TaxID=69332 RepID=A0A388JQH2_CHABU|nr:hypothetical protein CBR_g371 [Chara braunii]|eukprot:GBG60040.1 hypothetical protein CBR_g371 [Chara braunii]